MPDPNPNQPSLLQRILAMKFLQPNPPDPTYGGGFNPDPDLTPSGGPTGSGGGGSSWDFMQPQAPVKGGASPYGQTPHDPSGMPTPPPTPSTFSQGVPPPPTQTPDPGSSMVQGSGLPPTGPTNVPPLNFSDQPTPGSPMMGVGMEGLQGGMVNNMANAQQPLPTSPLSYGDVGGGVQDSNVFTGGDPAGLPNPMNLRMGQNYNTGQEQPNDLVHLIKRLIHKR